MVKETTGVNLQDNAPDGIAISDAEAKKARHDGAIEQAKEAGKDMYKSLTDGVLPGDPPAKQFEYLGYDDITQYAYILDMGVEEFTEVVTGKTDREIPEAKLYGLLALERNGQNRTPYVKTLMKRLKLKKEDLPGGGPDYTNDITAVSKL